MKGDLTITYVHLIGYLNSAIKAIAVYICSA